MKFYLHLTALWFYKIPLKEDNSKQDYIKYKKNSSNPNEKIKR